MQIPRHKSSPGGVSESLGQGLLLTSSPRLGFSGNYTFASDAYAGTHGRSSTPETKLLPTTISSPSCSPFHQFTDVSHVHVVLQVNWRVSGELTVLCLLTLLPAYRCQHQGLCGTASNATNSHAASFAPGQDGGWAARQILLSTLILRRTSGHSVFLKAPSH